MEKFNVDNLTVLYRLPVGDDNEISYNLGELMSGFVGNEDAAIEAAKQFVKQLGQAVITDGNESAQFVLMQICTTFEGRDLGGLQTFRGIAILDGTIIACPLNEEFITNAMMVPVYEVENNEARLLLNEEGEQIVYRDILLGALAHALLARKLTDFLEAQKTLESLETDKTLRQSVKKPRKRNDPITKVAQNITNPALFDEVGALVDVAGKSEKKAGKSVTTSVSIKIPRDNVEIEKKLTEWDNEVYNGVISLWNAGNKVFTAAQVFEATAGSYPKSKDQIAKTTASLDKFRFMYVKLDYTEEARGRDLRDENGNEISPILETYLLAAEKIIIRTANGIKSEGYMLLREPVLYTHAKAIGQVASYPARYLETSTDFNNTEQNVLIKTYLIRRITQAKNKKSKMGNRITYSSIFEHANIDSAKTQEKKRAYIKSLLNGWQNQGLFKSWENYYSGRGGKKIEGFEITF